MVEFVIILVSAHDGQGWLFWSK